MSAGHALTRRDFLAAGAGAMALPVLGGACGPAGGAELKQGGHHIPADKNLSKEWVDSLFARGASKEYRGDDRACIGMPVGGVCAGQLYIRGDGTLASWEIFNRDHNTGFGDTSYRTYVPHAPLAQGVALKILDGKQNPSFTLDGVNFPDVSFVGEYPLARVQFGQPRSGKLPVEISLEAFSPFVPLDTRDSALPATILRYRVRNTSDEPVEAALWGWLENTIGAAHAGTAFGEARTAAVRTAGMTSVVLSAEDTAPPETANPRPPVVFASFEGADYGLWKSTGTAFGTAPAHGTLPNQQAVSGFEGKGLVNTYLNGDQTTGTLVSPEFTIDRPYILFRLGGGRHPGRTCMNLTLIRNPIDTAGGRPLPRPVPATVRSATGEDNERLTWHYWNVAELKGQSAVLEIIDQETGGWGHINVDDIQFADALPEHIRPVKLAEQADVGTMTLTVLDPNADAVTSAYDQLRTHTDFPREPQAHTMPIGRPGAGGVSSRFRLDPGEQRDVTFLVTWHFAQGERGRAYGTRFNDALEVASYVRRNIDRLTRLTHLFHDTYYDSTLPHWLLDRLLMPVSTLATNTCQWWRNGRFWAWEGVGCCHGTCTHVWNYAQAVGRLFPELERSARTMQDLGPALDPKTGRVAFRGEGPGFDYAADGQCGTVLKCYREHLMSADGRFLADNWPRIRQVMEYSISRDGNADGIIADQQHNTYDINFVGPNTFVGALYLAALEAAARMAELQNDRPFAERCRAIAAKGRQWTVDHLWNGEYFEQQIPEGASARFQYGKGCLADQVFGHNWANQLDLGYVYPRELVVKALKAVYRYNWAPDVAAQNQAHPPQRWFARPGDAGLFTCTWPSGGRPDEPVLYRDEVWTGIEYQVAAHLLHEGLIREGLSIIKGVHDRYDGRRHNPWNEVECGDHYARALASWGCLLALEGFVYDAPAGRLGFAPRWQADDFRAFFSAAEGWGTLAQRRQANTQTCSVIVRYGHVAARELVFELPENARLVRASVEVDGRARPAQHSQSGRLITLTLAEPALVETGKSLVAALDWRND